MSTSSSVSSESVNGKKTKVEVHGVQESSACLRVPSHDREVALSPRIWTCDAFKVLPMCVAQGFESGLDSALFLLVFFAGERGVAPEGHEGAGLKYHFKVRESV